MKRAHVVALIIVFVGVGFLLCPGRPDTEQVNPEVLLDNMIRAEHTVPYSADQVYESICLGKAHQKHVRCMQRDSSVSYAPNWCVSGIKLNYIPLVEGEDRVAGREVWTLRLMPNRDKYAWRKHAPWKQFWVDKETYVVLASREWTSNNTIKRSMRTESITYGELRPLPKLSGIIASGDLVSKGIMNRIRQDAQYGPRIERSIPRYMPGGFELVEAQCVRGSFYRLTYTDGLYCIGILGEIKPETQKPSASRIMDCGQSLVCKLSRDNRSLVVTADLPVEEFRKVIHSID